VFVDKKKITRELVELFIRVVERYNALEKIPVTAGSRHKVYHSERHMIDRVGDQPGMNLTEFARSIGVTKGAVSQVVSKLETKGLVRRIRAEADAKTVYLELTPAGRDLYEKRKQVNEETLRPLYEELKNHPEEHVEFLVHMFRWFEGFLDQSLNAMKAHEGHSK